MSGQPPAGGTDPADVASRLPIYEQEAAIVAALTRHRVVVLEGPTGSGKTTQLPRILSRAGFGEVGRIGVTQPRRIAAVSVAHRIAAEEHVSVGDEVGYAIRFDDRTGPATRIKIMTDGILLQEVRSDPNLRDYQVLIIDEAHERSLNIDFCLGLLHRLVTSRQDLYVMVTSATIRPAEFQAFFGGAVGGEVPLISVSSGVHQVNKTYRPLRSYDIDSVAEAVSREAVSFHSQGGPGHILAFLTGEAMIHRTAALIEKTRAGRGLVVLPLYGRLTREEQERVFDEFGSRRKVVLATNIAETSITIPDVRLVIDCGLAKIPRYDSRTAITALREEPISQASAAQRAGRAGRTAPGRVVRLYSESGLRSQPDFTDEEIIRQDLAEVVLRLIDLGIHDIESFPFPTRPATPKLRAALDSLTRLGAIDARRRLTDVGRKMVPFPLSPPLARMVVESLDRFPDVLDEVLVAAGFLSSRPPFLFPPGEELQARQAQADWAQPSGDAETAIAVFKAWHGAADRARFCKRHYLDPDVMAFIDKVRRQLGDIAESLGAEVKGGGKPTHVIRCLARGFPGGMLRRRGRLYVTSGGAKIAIHPGSALYSRRPDYAVAAELVISSRTYARQVSVVHPSWIAEIDAEVAKAWGRRGQRKKVDETPTEIVLDDVTLTVRPRKGRPYVDIPIRVVERLIAVDPKALDRRWRRLPARVVTRHGAFARGEALGKLLRQLPFLPLPRSELDLVEGVPEGALLDVDTHWRLLAKGAEWLLRPSLGEGSRTGWIALVANAVGSYWYEVMARFVDAVDTTAISLDHLVSTQTEERPGLAELRERLSEIEALSKTLRQR